MIKYYRFRYDYVLHGISYLNLVMLLASIPDVSEMSKPKREDDPDQEETELEGSDLKDAFGVF